MLDKFRKRINDSIDNNHIVAIDIGTEFVKAMIAKIEGDKLNIVGVGRVRQDIGDMYAGAIADISAVVRNCENALADAEDQAGLQAKRVVIGMAGELVKGVTDTVRYRRPNPSRPLDETEMEFIIEKVQERAQVKAQRQIGLETGNPEVEIKLVNSALVGLYIDGYKVSNPLGFQGKDIAIQIYTAFAPMIHIGALERVADELSLELLAVAAEPFAVSRSVLGGDSGSEFTAIIADVGGGTTDIAVINDGGVEGTKMFGIGGRSFTRAISQSMDIPYEAAEKLKVNLEDEKMKPNVKQEIEESLEEPLDIWIQGVSLALEEFDSVDHLPNKVLLCGGGASLKALVQKLKTDDWYKSLPMTKKPVIKLIKPTDVIGIEDSTKKASDHTFITAMGLLRVGLDTIDGEAENAGIKDKINKVMKI